MRPQGAVGSLVAIAVGAILTYAVRFTISGISIHTVGVIIMLAGVAALAILLIRAVSASRRRDQARQAAIEAGPGPDANYPQDLVRGAPQVAATRISTETYRTPETYRMPETRR
jgi:high-affinity Fe2+/Pb2+ permease